MTRKVLLLNWSAAMLIAALSGAAAFAQGATAGAAAGTTAAASASAPVAAATMAGATATTAAPAKPETSFMDSPDGSETPGSALPNVGTTLARLVGAMLLITALMVGGLVLIKRFTRRSLNFARGGEKPLRVMEKVALGPKSQVCLLNACGRLLVIGVTEKEINVLMEVTLPGESVGEAETPRSEGISKDFASLLSGTAPVAQGEK